MVDDKWSLKGKIEKQAHVGKIDGELVVIRDYDFVKYENIETLRQKLIDDWHDYCVSREPKKRLYDEFVKIIDNRFGVNMDDL